MQERGLVIADLEGAVRFYYSQGLAESTRRTYDAGMRRFYRFCDAYKISAPFPVSEINPPCVLLCLSPIANDNLAAQTIKTYLATVRGTHIALGCPDPRAHAAMPRLDRIEAGIRRVLASRGKKKATRLPLTPAILERMRQHWASGGDENWQLYWATSALCYFGFFRLGKLLLPTEVPSRALMRWGDVTRPSPRS